ncbi:FecR family protein [Pedobacter sp. SYSU D00535]|uniref:FecR family protein n=1 Tax=Pedobacter sp. SYSU D00535 TaxID=2810308 RepID=UPI001A969152|nr:FecR domain-containing protein [Pedobacter sp. SYSU D00535]
MYSKKYSLEDLIVDPGFIKWVKAPHQHNGAVWEAWAAQSYENSNVVDEAREIVLGFASDIDEPMQQELNDVWNRIVATNEEFDSQTTPTKSIRFSSFVAAWQKVAAVTVGFLVLSAAVFFYLTGKEEQRTDFAENKRIVLPDQSVVILNANSSISFTNNWGEDKPREVWLKGEAFFSVTHKKNSQKFVVHTPDLDVQVLGTKFNVNTRRGKTKVILNSGKVKLFLLQDVHQVVDMKPNQMVNFSQKTKQVEKLQVSAPDFSSWTEQKLVFDETPLKEIADLLEDNYGYQVSFLDHEVATLTFTGSIDAANVDLLLTILKKTFNISIVKKEDAIIIDSAP